MLGLLTARQTVVSRNQLSCPTGWLTSILLALLEAEAGGAYIGAHPWEFNNLVRTCVKIESERGTERSSVYAPGFNGWGVGGQVSCIE